MSDRSGARMLMDPKSWIQYRQFVDSQRPIANPYLNDPEYLKLYRQYIISLEAFVKAVCDAVEFHERSDSPGPRRHIDFSRLDSLRRSYEGDAYKYFTYRQGFKTQSPPETRSRVARGYVKDARTAQFFGNEERVIGKLGHARKEIEKLCEEVWKRYREAREPRSEEMKRGLVEALMLAQEAQAESATINQMSVEAGRLSPGR
jgi:hypothetical protein